MSVSVSFGALGSTAVVAVGDASALERARAAVERVLNQIDLACSRFREDSELAAVNARAGDAVRVSPLMLDAVEAALRAAELTDGDVDPTVGAALIELGYDRDFELLAAWDAPTPTVAPAPRVRASAVPGWRTVRVDRVARTVQVPPGARLDLGATAKALAGDLAAARAREETGGAGVLVSLGGDIAMCGEVPAGGWRIRVTDDHRSDEHAPGQWITLFSGGLATSSTTTRRWRPDAHHLVDPATGESAQSIWRTVSVAAASCLDANIASTAAIIRSERAIPWLESLGLPSRLVGNDGQVRHVAGWPAQGDDLAEAGAGAPSAPERIPA